MPAGKKTRLKLVSGAAGEEGMRDGDILAAAARTLETEASGLSELRVALNNGLREPFVELVRLIHKTDGRVIVSGMGKSGHVGRKISATLASTGTPSFFVHPGEASHGDLGMIRPEDVIVALSWSGETAELSGLIHYSRRFAVPLVAVTSNPRSTLAKASDTALILPRADEACPHGLAPTTSTLMQLAFGDALAVTLLEARGFTALDFKAIHPGGSLGANLKTVRDIMHSGDELPLVPPDMAMSEAVIVMTEKSMGCLGVTDADGCLIGVITDGDLRRHMGPDMLRQETGKLMTRKPKTVKPEMLASSALELLNSARITSLFVVEKRRPIGLVHVHDLLRIGVA
jgi:arabinose-5-phosphate isomerase